MQSINDPAARDLIELTSYLVRAGTVDGFLVEFLPFLQHLPAAIAPWKAEALRAAPRFSKRFQGLYAVVQARVVSAVLRTIERYAPLMQYCHSRYVHQAEGDTRASVAASMIEKQGVKHDLTDKETSWLLATMWVALLLQAFPLPNADPDPDPIAFHSSVRPRSRRYVFIDQPCAGSRNVPLA